MKLILRILKYTITGIFVLLILILSIFLLSRLVSKKSYSQVFGYSFFEVSSYSMYPELDKGDLVIVKQRDSEDYEVGMVVTYCVVEGTTPVTHKIVKREGDIITTRGVNTETNNTDDEPFDVKYIIGEVVDVYEDYGDFVSFIQNPLGLCIVIISCVILFEIFDFLEKKTVKQ